jgi:hypothetical protein
VVDSTPVIFLIPVGGAIMGGVTAGVPSLLLGVAIGVGIVGFGGVAIVLALLVGSGTVKPVCCFVGILL